MLVDLPIAFIYDRTILFLEEMKKLKITYFIVQESIIADLVCTEV